MYGADTYHAHRPTDIDVRLPQWRTRYTPILRFRPDNVKGKFIRMRDYIMNTHSTLRGSIEDAMVCAVGASHRMMNNLLRRL